LLLREQYYLDKINPSLNTCKTAGSPLGVKRDIIFSVNLSKARRGKNISKMVNRARKTNIITSETRLKMASRSKGVIVKIYDKSKNFLYQFPNMGSAAKHFGVSYSTIGNILKTGISYDNYIYKFEVITEHPIIVVNKENNYIKEYHSLREAAKDLGVSNTTVLKYINTNKLLKGICLITRKQTV
jgi:predicted DNA binding protein